MTRARFIVSIAFLMAMPALADAQNYPNRLIKLMHGFPPGGNVDVIARVMADEMSKGFGRPIVIEAKPGVVGSLAAETVVRSPADGYTLLFLPSALTVTSKNRWKDLSDVPTLEEAGVPNSEVIYWPGFAAPPGTPQTVIDRIHTDIQRSIKVHGVKERLASLGGDVRGTSPAELRALVARQVALWAKLAKEADIQTQ